MPSEFRPLSLPLLAHIFGDAFPKDAEHETANVKDLFQYFVRFLEGFIINPESLAHWFHLDRLQWILKTVDYSLQLEKRMYDRWRQLAVMRDEEEAQYVLEEAKHDLYIHLYQLLQTEENALIAGGWTRKRRNHDMLYEFIRESEDTYIFRLYNSFDHNFPHQLLALKGRKVDHRGFIEIINLRLKDLIEPRFLKALVEIHLCIQMPSEKIISYLDTAYSEKDIYNGLLALLNGSISREDPILEEMLNPAHKGTTTWKSFCAWLRKHLSYEEYHRLIYIFRFESLKQYAGQRGDLLSLQPGDGAKQTEELACIKAIANALTKDMQKMSNSSILSITDKENAQSFLASLFNGIQKAELFLQSLMREELANLDLSSPMEAKTYTTYLPELERKPELLAALKRKEDIENKASVILPRAILTQQDFYSIFDGEILARQIDPFTYYFTDEGLPNYVRLTLFGNIIIQRFFNELGWYQYIPSFQLGQEGEGYAMLWGNRAIVEGCTHWISLSSQEDMLICRIPGKTPSYSVKLARGEHGLEVKNIFRLPEGENKKQTQLIPWERTNPHVGSLAAFEDPSFICLWANQNNRIVLIEFLRFGLQFMVKNVNGAAKAFSQEFPGFHLDARQVIKIFKSFTDYLVLTNDHREKKILIPRYPIKEQKALVREQQVHLDRSFAWHQKLQKYFVYDLTEEGILFSNDVEACLFAGIIFLASRQYKMAMYYFRNFCHKTGPYTKGEKELLDWGIGLSEKNNDYHIHAFSLRLYLAWLKFHNAEMAADTEVSPSHSRNYWFRLAAQLSEYAEKPLQTSNLALESEKEIFLLRKILFYVPSEVLMKRLSKLAEETSSQPAETEQNPEVIERKALIASKLPASLTTLISATPRSAILFTRPGWAFLERFMHNYALIRLPEHDEKKKLFQQLLFIHNDPHPEIRLLGRILEETAKNPGRFPSIAEMYAILHSDNTLAFRKKVIIPTLQISFLGKRKRKQKKSL